MTIVNINDYVECLLMKGKLVTLKDGVISGDGFTCALDEYESKYDGKFACHVFQVQGRYTVALLNKYNDVLVIHAGMIN